MTVINTNVSALRAQNNSRLASKMQNNAMERLSSGKRINSARDDAAGLAIATRMDANARGMTQAIRNASDGISAAQTAESAMGNISNILVRMRELAMQAVNGTNSVTDRAAIQVEVDALVEQIGDISLRTDFNGQALLSGGTTAITPAVAAVPAVAATPAVVGTGTPAAPQFPANPGSPAVEAVDAIVGTTFSIQTGVSAGDTVDLSIANMDADTLGVDDLDVSTAAGASTALTALDTAINSVASQRANIGAQQNRLDAAIDSLTSSVTNLQESKSRIEDTDFSAESTKLAAASILSQASTAMLAQANQSQQGVLNLLR